MRGVYTANYTITSLNAAKSLMTLLAPSTACLEILNANITNLDSEVSEQLSVGLFNITTYGSPAGTSVTPEKHENLDAASTTTVLANLSGEPTAYAANPIDKQGINNLSGYRYDPMPEERPIVGPSRGIGLRLLVTPSGVFNCSVQIVYREIG